MKNFFFVCCCLIAINALAQSIPFNINYQAIARDADGLPIPNADIDATINLLQGDPGGAIVFSEKHYTSTNAFGMYLIVIGDGEGQDDLKNIEWAESDYYIETIIKIDGGQELTSISKLNSVPYAFLAYKSVVDETEDEDSDKTNEIQELSLDGTYLSISHGNEVDLSKLAEEIGKGFEETISTLVDNGDGSFTYVAEDGHSTTFYSYGPQIVTSIRLNADRSSIDYVDEDGITTNLNLCNIVDNCETMTSIEYNEITNQLTYTDEEGRKTEIQLNGSNGVETLTSLSYDSANNLLQYIDENGVVNIISLGLVNPTGGLTETVSTLENHGDGSFTYTAEDGSKTEYEETKTSIGLNADGSSFDYKGEDGITTNLNLCHIVDNCETVTSLVKETNSTLVYTDENGKQSTLEINEFREDDPEDASRSIVYAPISGPEQAIFQRGTSQLVNGERYIQFSDHFRKLIAENTMTVSLTAHSSNTYGLAVIEKTKDGIIVKELMNGTSDFSFDWEVKATRKSQLSYQVIRPN